MQDLEYLEIPLKNKTGQIVAYTKVDYDVYNDVTQYKWCLSRGYATNVKFRLHRYVMGAKKGDPLVDHINGDPLDNRLVNLRFATASQNCQNRKKKEGLTSQYKGVSLTENKNKKWMCTININNTSKKITFEKETHAAYFYDLQAIQYYGPNANINGIAKPKDFIEPVAIKDNADVLPKNVHFFQNKYVVVIKGKYIGRYISLEEAVKERNKKIKEYEEEENKIEQIRLTTEIKRNANGIAIIEIFAKHTNKIMEVLIDDDKYYYLTKYSSHINKDGYTICIIGSKKHLLHRFLLNAKTGEIVDHINKNRLDNRVQNLRISDNERKKCTQ
jgi:hypothetical protein